LFIFTYKQFGRNFFKYSLIAFIASAAFGFIFSLVPVLDELNFFGIFIDTGSVAIFASVIGGILYGIGSALIFSAGACTMGTDPVAKYISRRFKKSITLFTVIFSVVNSII
jgi:uncharacterized membrane-anchored protein YitT (DUF2179 family)